MYEPDELLEMLYEERMAPTLDDDEYELFATNEEDEDE